MTTGTAETPQSTPRTIFELFADVKRKVGPVGKNSVNQQQHFNFRGIDAVVNAAAPALDEHGVITIPMLQDIAYNDVEVGKNRSVMAHVRVKVTYRFQGPAGDHFDATVPGEAMDSGDKATAKAMSVAYRIALIQALNLPTGDPDPDSQTYERSDRSAGRSAGDAFENAAPAASRPQRPNGRPPGPAVDLGDWGALIDAITGPGDEPAAEAEVSEAVSDGRLDDVKAAAIRRAIKAKVASLTNGAKRPNGSAQANGEDMEWLAEFRASLDGLDAAQLGAKRGEIGRAVAARKILPETGAALSGEIAKLRQAATA